MSSTITSRSHQRANTVNISSPIARGLVQSSPTPSIRPDASFLSSTPLSSHAPRTQSPSSLRGAEVQQEKEAIRTAAMAQIEQVRMLILGMDQRLDMREERLSKTIHKAEDESKHFEDAVTAAAAVGVGPA